MARKPIQNRSSVVTNSIKTLKTVHFQKTFKKKKTQELGSREWREDSGQLHQGHELVAFFLAVSEQFLTVIFLNPEGMMIWTI